MLGSKVEAIVTPVNDGKWRSIMIGIGSDAR